MVSLWGEVYSSYMVSLWGEVFSSYMVSVGWGIQQLYGEFVGWGIHQLYGEFVGWGIQQILVEFMGWSIQQLYGEFVGWGIQQLYGDFLFGVYVMCWLCGALRVIQILLTEYIAVYHLCRRKTPWQLSWFDASQIRELLNAIARHISHKRMFTEWLITAVLFVFILWCIFTWKLHYRRSH